MLRKFLTQTLQLLVAALNIGQQALGEGAILNIGQDILHALLGIGINNARARNVAAKLGSIRYRVVHVGDAALKHQVHDELHLVQHLKVGHFWLVSSLSQNLEAGANQELYATAQNSLLTKEVSNRLCFEGRRDNAGTRTTDGCCIRQGQIVAFALRILFGSNKARNTLAINELAANQMTRPLRRNHANGDIGLRFNQLKVDIQAVPKQQRIAVFQVGGNFIFKDLLLRGIWCQQHDYVCPLGSFCYGLDLKAGFLGLCRRLGAFTQTNNNLDAGIAQVLRVRVPLGAVANNGYLATLNDRQIRIIVVEGFNSHVVVLNSVVIVSSMN